MRCEEVREALELERMEELSVPIRDHVASCAACEAYARDWRLVRAGFRALARDLVPEASVGFATRVVRRLGERAGPGGAAVEFFERAGRRAVWATFLLALMLLFALVLPSSGPLRAPSATEVSPAQPEVITAEIDPALAGDFSEKQALPPANPTNDRGKRKR